MACQAMVGNKNELSGRLFFTTANSQSAGLKTAPKYPMVFEDHVCCLLESWFGLDRSQVTPILRDWAYKEHNIYNKQTQAQATTPVSNSSQQQTASVEKNTQEFATQSTDNNNNPANANDLNTEDILEGLVGADGLIQLDVSELTSFM